MFKNSLPLNELSLYQDYNHVYDPKNPLATVFCTSAKQAEDIFLQAKGQCSLVYDFYSSDLLSLAEKDKNADDIHRIFYCYVLLEKGDFPKDRKTIEATASELKKISANNLPVALRLAGDLYSSSDEESRQKEALDSYKAAAETGDLLACSGLYYYYLQKARSSSDKGEESAQEAFNNIIKPAEAGSAEAQKNLAFLYERGIGVRNSFKTAKEWFAKAAAQGESEAMYELAGFLLKGFALPSERTKAFELYQESARLGFAESMFKLGECYEKGVGVLKNQKTADEWYNKACAKGSYLAVQRENVLFERDVAGYKPGSGKNKKSN